MEPQSIVFRMDYWLCWGKVVYMHGDCHEFSDGKIEDCEWKKETQKDNGTKAMKFLPGDEYQQMWMNPRVKECMKLLFRFERYENE